VRNCAEPCGTVQNRAELCRNVWNCAELCSTQTRIYCAAIHTSDINKLINTSDALEILTARLWNNIQSTETIQCLLGNVSVVTRHTLHICTVDEILFISTMLCVDVRVTYLLCCAVLLTAHSSPTVTRPTVCAVSTGRYTQLRSVQQVPVGTHSYGLCSKYRSVHTATVCAVSTGLYTQLRSVQ